jgi:beta-lactamase regulating signal transducer with metallopeptidase domain
MVGLMILGDFHTFFIYVFFGYLFIFPAVLFCLKVFDIQHSRQRMSFYLLALLSPFVGFALYHTVLVKRCQSGAVAGGPLWQFFDTLCAMGNSAIRFLGPVLLFLLVLGLLKALAGTLYLTRLRARIVEPEVGRRERVTAIIQERCRQWQMPVPEVLFTERAGFAAFAAGLFRPVVVVSISIVNQLSDRELEGILIHELVHIRRNDTITGWMLHIIRDLMIFSPFSTVLLDRYFLERERICDRETVDILGTSHEYATTLLKVWRLLLDKKSFRPQISVGFTGKKRDLEKRVMSLMESKEKNNVLPAVLFLTLLISVASVTVLFLGLIC